MELFSVSWSCILLKWTWVRSIVIMIMVLLDSLSLYVWFYLRENVKANSINDEVMLDDRCKVNSG